MLIKRLNCDYLQVMCFLIHHGTNFFNTLLAYFKPPLYQPTMDVPPFPFPALSRLDRRSPRRRRLHRLWSLQSHSRWLSCRWVFGQSCPGRGIGEWPKQRPNLTLFFSPFKLRIAKILLSEESYYEVCVCIFLFHIIYPPLKNTSNVIFLLSCNHYFFVTIIFFICGS